MLEKIRESVNYIHSKFSLKAKTALILGSGLSDFIKSVEVVDTIPYTQIPNFPNTSVEGHAGRLLHARHNNTEVLIMQGRIHFYEGHTMEILTYPIRVLKYLGIENLVLSNASGGMNENYQIGDLMVLNDHINLMPNPLIGTHYPEFGEQFVDMSMPYHKPHIEKALTIAKQLKIKLHQGVYVAVTGPTYETPAEYNYFRIIGGDTVGMSTVPEVIVANQMGIRCFAISIITDLGVPGKIKYINHEMVQKAAAKAEPKMTSLVTALIATFE
jgi:purine-nucleoside phosphorylase